MRKAIIIALAFLVLGFVFFLSEERHEDGLSEVIYWKINPEEIRYSPPKNSEEFSKFISTNLDFKKMQIGIKSPPLYSIQGIDLETKEKFTYEGNYNVKNLFTELSVLSTKSINQSMPKLLENFSISTDASPSIEILVSTRSEKKVFLGEETRDKANRYLLSGNELITAPSHIFQKFASPSFDFRDRQYLRFGEFELMRMQVQGEGLRIIIENNPETKNGIKNSNWFKLGSGKQRIDPANGGDLFGLLQGFKADLYPDESDGEGFAVSKELVSMDSFATIDVFLINGLHYKIKLFPKAVLKNKSYYPVKKEVEKFFIEYPSYASDQSVLKLLDLIKKIQSAPEWTEPKGK